MILNYTMHRQEHDNWCWAACAAATARYFDAATEWTQCEVANEELGHRHCCDDPVPRTCDVYGYLERALHVIGRSTIPYARLRDRYHRSGTWTHSYFTKA